MFLLKLFVKEQVISYDLRRPLVADSVGQAFVEFDFDEEWDGLTCTANFENSATESPVSVLLAGGQVEIPPEVLVPGYLQISVVGLAGEGAKQVPTAKMTAPIKVYAAGPGIGAVPEGSTPELWKQVLAVIGQVSNLDTKDKSNLVAAINEVLRKAGTGGGSGSGADGATFIPHVSEDGWLSWTNDKGLPDPEPVNIKGTTPERGVDYWTAEDQEDIKNYIDQEIGNIEVVLDEIIAVQESYIALNPRHVNEEVLG